MKGNLFTSYYSQLENQLTEAFIKVLRYGTPELTQSFLLYAGIEGDYGDFKYDFQFGTAVQSRYNRNILIGIAETAEIDEEPTKEEETQDREYEGIADGYLHAAKGSLAVLFEVKRGAGILNRPQLNAHKRRFKWMNPNQVEERLLTWRMVLEFLRTEREKYKSIHRNVLLIDGFIEFCSYHLIGKVSSELTPGEIINRYDLSGYLMELHDFASNFPGVTPLLSKSGSIEYYAVAPNGAKRVFFTLWYAREIIVLKPKKMVGLYLDLLVAKTFLQNVEISYNYKTQETFIMFDWIQSREHLQLLRSWITTTYQNKINNQSIDIQKFISNNKITLKDFENSRIGREDDSFFHVKGYQNGIEPLRKAIRSILSLG
ncbi:hypothetical protein F4V43_19270 [Paenibacillus spiritus]|uniref:Uncharacterized protein n=1 Tax=Paenibacillus spiritus TaxID=2496557 RepID=A0A5J5FR34_9BACL|nr:hypothetical protein [Paenibacillus spiritus]KAA8995541.1 hypothetical protein F4V43_19270 [Paenibacillus spiritus]